MTGTARNKVIFLRCDERLHKDVALVAAARGMSRARVVEMLLRQAVDDVLPDILRKIHEDNQRRAAALLAALDPDKP